MANTIPALKRSFLSSQVRVLNTPLELGEDWRDAGPSPDEGDLKDAVVDEVLRKVNKTIKQHNASVFPAQTLSHVAQQIDSLYWAEAEPAAEGRELLPGAISVDADLRDDAIIVSLPASFRSPNSSPTASPAQPKPRPNKRLRTSTLEVFDTSTRYARLRDQLQELNTQRHEAQQKLEEVKARAELLRPLRDAKQNIQPNLPGRDSELEREMERMKVLGARLVAVLRSRQGPSSLMVSAEHSHQTSEAQQEKDAGDRLQALLEMET